MNSASKGVIATWLGFAYHAVEKGLDDADYYIDEKNEVQHWLSLPYVPDGKILVTITWVPAEEENVDDYEELPGSDELEESFPTVPFPTYQEPVKPDPMLTATEVAELAGVLGKPSGFTVDYIKALNEAYTKGVEKGLGKTTEGGEHVAEESH